MIRRFIFGAALAVASLATLAPVHAEEGAALFPTTFSFEGPFGTLDKASAQRGLQIYTEVCSACHGLYELSYRNIEELGYTEEQAKAYAAQHQVADTNDSGEPIQRAARPSDKFVRPFANEKAARAANNGAYPPDLALIVKARAGGPHYTNALLQGYKDPPADMKMANGMNYNVVFAGNQIAMPQPLTDGAVKFADGSPNDLAHEAHDVSTFLYWASNPEADHRKAMGVRVVLYLIVLAFVLYGAKRYIWRDLH